MSMQDMTNEQEVGPIVFYKHSERMTSEAESQRPSLSVEMQRQSLLNWSVGVEVRWLRGASQHYKM